VALVVLQQMVLDIGGQDVDCKSYWDPLLVKVLHPTSRQLLSAHFLLFIDEFLNKTPTSAVAIISTSSYNPTPLSRCYLVIAHSMQPICSRHLSKSCGIFAVVTRNRSDGEL